MLRRRWNALDEIDQFGHEVGSSGIDVEQVLAGKAIEVADEAAAQSAQGDEQAVGNGKGGQSHGQEIARDMDRPCFPMDLRSHKKMATVDLSFPFSSVRLGP